MNSAVSPKAWVKGCILAPIQPQLSDATARLSEAATDGDAIVELHREGINGCVESWHLTKADICRAVGGKARDPAERNSSKGCEGTADDHASIANDAYG